MQVSSFDFKRLALGPIYFAKMNIKTVIQKLESIKLIRKARIGLIISICYSLNIAFKPQSL